MVGARSPGGGLAGDRSSSIPGDDVGIVRHYWVVFKLGLTVVATGVLVLYMQTFEYLARVAADPGVGLEAVRNFSPVLHSVAAALVLLVATVLAVYKPRGLTRYGQRKKAPLAA